MGYFTVTGGQLPGVFITRFPQGMNGYRNLPLKPFNTDEIPVILSVPWMVFDKVKAFSVGGVDYITKPFQNWSALVRVDNHLTPSQGTFRHKISVLQQRAKTLQAEQERIRQPSKLKIATLKAESVLFDITNSLGHWVAHQMGNSYITLWQGPDKAYFIRQSN